MTAIAKREIAFIDCGVDDLATLLAGIRPDVEAIVLLDDEPASRQIARAVQGREGLEAIHVIAHGRPGEVSFGAGALSPDTIIEYAAELAEVASDPLDIPSLTDSHSTQPILNFSHPSDCSEALWPTVKTPHRSTEHFRSRGISFEEQRLGRAL